MRIFTVGTSVREKEEFLSLLKVYRVECVVDVRAFPRSRFPHFESTALSSFLPQSGIKYVYMGKELGGYRKGGYKNYTKSASFEEGIRKVCDIASSLSTALMCCERLPWRCHRRYIADALRNMGHEVVHIIDESRTWVQKHGSSSTS
jgi:uncharacterized protein (DUF488 family)